MADTPVDPSRPVGELPSSICALPWLNLSLDVDGSSRPCCKFAHASEASPYQLDNLRQGSLEQVWNGPAMQQLRRDFRDGVRPDECRACWDEEAAGLRSFRQTYLDDRGIVSRPDFDDLTPAQPVAFDLKLSNACNLKCRICGPVASSAWLAEEVAHGAPGSATTEFLKQNRSYFQSNKLTQVEGNRELLERWAPAVEHVEMTGGEPMLSRENRDMIELLVEHGHPERISLLLTTNATIIDDRILDQLHRFGSVVISLSIDDVGERLEYQRGPLEWADVRSNMARYAELASPTCQVFTNCSVSVFNVWDLPEYLDWMQREYRDGRISVNLNPVHYPRSFSVQVLPAPLAHEVRERLRVARAALASDAPLGAQLDGLIALVGAAGDEGAADWDLGVRTIESRDRIRGERFAEVFPDYHARMVELGVWPREAAPTARHRTRRLIARIRG